MRTRTPGLPPIAPMFAPPALALPGAAPFVPLTTAPPVPTGTARIEHAAALTQEAEAWIAHATATTQMRPATILRKALDAVGFSIRRQAQALAVPSKLRGVSARQDAVALLARHADTLPRGGIGLRLHVEDAASELAVSFEAPDGSGRWVLGLVQRKHAPWLRPLLACGATVRLSAVTGREKGRTMGVNVLFAHVGRAIHARRFTAGGAPNPSEHDVVLVRDRAGTAEVRLGRGALPNREDFEWGYAGAGPSRLALAILRRFTSEDDAQRLRRDFLDDVLCKAPRQGVTIESGFVRAWIAHHTAN